MSGYNYFSAQESIEEISYTTFKKYVLQNRINGITVKGTTVTGPLASEPEQAGGSPGEPDRNEPAEERPINDAGGQNEGRGEKESATPGKQAPQKRFRTIIPPFEDPELTQMLETNGVTIQAEPEASMFWTVVISFLPWLLIIGFFVYGSRKMQERLGLAFACHVFDPPAP